MASNRRQLSRAQEGRLHRRPQGRPVRPAARVDRLRRRLAVHGDGVSTAKRSKLAEVREAMGIGRDGVSAKAILDTAERYGLARPRHQGRRLADQAGQAGDDPALGVQPLRRVRPARARTASASSIRRPARATCRWPSSRRRSPASRSSSRRRRACMKTKYEKGRLKRYLDELLSEKGLFSRVIVVSLFLRLIALALPLMTGMIIDRVVPRGDYHLLYVCLARDRRHGRVQPDLRGRARAPAAAPAHRARHADDARLPRPHGLAAVPVLPAALDGRPDDARRLERHGARDRDEQVDVGRDRRPVRAALRGVIFYISPTLGVITIAMSGAEALVFLVRAPDVHAPARGVARQAGEGAQLHGPAARRHGDAEVRRRGAARPREVEQPLHRRAQRQACATAARQRVRRRYPRRGRVAGPDADPDDRRDAA